MSELITGLAKIWKQWRCEHYWIPSRIDTRNGRGDITHSQPSKVCDYCQKVVELSPEEFYAIFNRICLMPDVEA